MSTTNNPIEIKAYSITELSGIYNVSKHTFSKWILPHKNAIGERRGRLYTHLQVKIIFEKLGLPGIIED